MLKCLTANGPGKSDTCGYLAFLSRFYRVAEGPQIDWRIYLNKYSLRSWEHYRVKLRSSTLIINDLAKNIQTKTKFLVGQVHVSTLEPVVPDDTYGHVKGLWSPRYSSFKLNRSSEFVRPRSIYFDCGSGAGLAAYEFKRNASPLLG